MKRPTQACVGAIEYDTGAVKRDAANLNAALEGSGATEGFLTAVAPASAAFNAADDYYHNERDYVMACSLEAANPRHEDEWRVWERAVLRSRKPSAACIRW